MKKIAVIGTHQVGKTLLCNMISTNLRKRGICHDLIDENVYDCPLPIGECQDNNSTYWLIASQIKAEMKAAAEDSNVIVCDRSVIDPLIYMLYSCPSMVSDELVNFVNDYSLTYTKIVLIRPNRRVITSKTSFEDDNYRYLIHSLYMAFCLGRVDVIGAEEITEAIEKGNDEFIEKILDFI